MSKISINYNKEAIKYINEAIEKYEDAISTIKKTNDNEKTDEIIRLINGNITGLIELKKRISGINDQIENKMNNS